jgi:serine/threonine protein kinase
MQGDDITEAAGEICNARSLKLLSEVGQGAFKRTFAVADANGQHHALKLFRQGAGARTQREVDAMTRCSHPAIAKFELIDGWINASGQQYVYLIEEFLAGGTLTQRLGQGGLFTREQVRQLALDLIDALAHIEGHALVHRDIKPDNIMFRDTSMSPVLVDFGLVRDLAQVSLTQTWQMQGPGTPYFAAPEQLNNAKAMIDWRTDQFALGVVLTICITDRHPFDTRKPNDPDPVQRVMARDAPVPEFVTWAGGAGLEPLIRMVQPWPVQRFRTPTLLAQAWSNGVQP